MLEGYKTYIGLFVVLVSELARVFGIEVVDGTELENSVLTLVGTVLAFYGRFVAKV